METNKSIWTIGHSTRPFEEFITLLRSFDIALVADIRSFPGSKRYPHFNKESLEASLPDNGIKYLHIKELGGRRKARADSENTGWRHPAFQGYADFMETEEFKNGIHILEQSALIQRTAYMCSEAVYWRCHRSLVSDHLKFRHWQVEHIMSAGKSKSHTYTSVAIVEDGKLHYRGLF